MRLSVRAEGSSFLSRRSRKNVCGILDPIIKSAWAFSLHGDISHGSLHVLSYVDSVKNPYAYYYHHVLFPSPSSGFSLTHLPLYGRYDRSPPDNEVSLRFVYGRTLRVKRTQEDKTVERNIVVLHGGVFFFFLRTKV